MIVGDTSLQPVNALAAGQQGYAFGQQQALVQNALAQHRQQQAQQQQLNSLAPQAFSSDPAQQQNAIAQMAAYGPQGIAQAKGIQGLQAGQQSQQAAVLQQLQQKRNDVAQMVAAVQAVQDPNARQQVYQQQIQLARAKGDPVDMFENLPADQGVQLAIGNIAKADQLLQAAGIGQKPISVSQGQTVYQPGPNGAMTPVVQGNPWKFDPTSGTMVNEQTGQFRPVTAADQGAAQGGAQSQGAPNPQTAGLPAETQAYVPKVLGALNGQPPFDANGQPTPAADGIRWRSQCRVAQGRAGRLPVHARNRRERGRYQSHGPGTGPRRRVKVPRAALPAVRR